MGRIRQRLGSRVRRRIWRWAAGIVEDSESRLDRGLRRGTGSHRTAAIPEGRRQGVASQTRNEVGHCGCGLPERIAAAADGRICAQGCCATRWYRHRGREDRSASKRMGEVGQARSRCHSHGGTRDMNVKNGQVSSDAQMIELIIRAFSTRLAIVSAAAHQVFIYMSRKAR
jgi:hypothetical protein